MPLPRLYLPETIFQFNIPAIARHTSVIGDCIRSFSATTGLATSRATCSQAKIVKAFQYFNWGKPHLQCSKIQHQLLGHERSIALIVSFVSQNILSDIVHLCWWTVLLDTNDCPLKKRPQKSATIWKDLVMAISVAPSWFADSLDKISPVSNPHLPLIKQSCVNNTFLDLAFDVLLKSTGCPRKNTLIKFLD